MNLAHLCIGILGLIWRGYVISCLYAWFVVTAFAGAPALTHTQCIGLSVLLGVAWTRLPHTSDDRDTKERMRDLVAVVIVAPAISLLVGYIVTRFL